MPANTPLPIPAEVAQTAFAALRTARAGRSWGAARCYVQFASPLGAKNVKTLEAAGFKVFSRQRASNKCIYVGYDNGTGLPYAQALAAATAFNIAGFLCYEDADED